jgi:hypothetical protein
MLIPASQGEQKPPGLYVDHDAYDVYSALIRSEMDAGKWIATGRTVKQIVIQEVTGEFPNWEKGSRCVPDGKQIDAEFRSALENYEKENDSPKQLARALDLDIPYAFANRKEYVGYFRRGVSAGWSAFYAKYPGSQGFLVFSVARFSSDRTKAIVYMGNSCGGLCGTGRYHFLAKVDGKWKEVDVGGTFCWWAS